MQCQHLLRLLGLCSLSVVVTAAPHQLRATSSFLAETRLRGSGSGSGNSHSWDYDNEGQSWMEGNCPHGQTVFSQSPVNISTTVAAVPPDDDNFFFKYPVYEAPVKMVNDGRFLYTLFPTDNDRIGGFAFGDSYPHHLTVEYFIYKMIFHTPSEHTFNGEKVPLEVQLFHRKKDAQLTDGEPAMEDLAIVAIGFAESRDEASPFLRALIDGGLPDQRGAHTLDNRGFPSRLDFSELFKPVFGSQGERAGFWDYTGSLTQPPCTGGVRWIVRQEAMNAKRQTLRLFKNVVRKSSHGVPDNARALQIMGTRPVFPRYARDAVHMRAFTPDEPDAFQEAMERVKGHQADFKKELKNDDAGSKAALEANMTAEQVVLASNEYKTCMNEMCQLSESLGVAKAKQEAECNQWEGAKKTLEGIAMGPARIEASAKAATFKRSCKDQAKVTQALEAQQSAQQAQCDQIKHKVLKKVEKERKEASEAAQKAKAKE